LAPFRYSFDDGSKFAGGFGVTELLLADYWTLRQRSSQLFEQNLYARGLIRRLVTNPRKPSSESQRTRLLNGARRRRTGSRSGATTQSYATRLSG
jgi:hypothetical protein